MNKIGLYIEGGVLQDILATNPEEMEIWVFDMDNPSLENWTADHVDPTSYQEWIEDAQGIIDDYQD